MATDEVKVEADEVEYCCPADFDSDEAMTKMFVNKIPKEHTDEQLKEAFSEWAIKSASIVKKDGKEMLFGFVIFEKCDDLDECLLKKAEIQEKTKYDGLKRAVPKDDSRKPNALYRTKKLFLGNVTEEITEKAIRDYIKLRHGKYAEVEEVHIMKKKDEKTGELTDVNKGFAFVTMKTEDMADRLHNSEKTAEIIKGCADDKKQRIARSQPRGDGQRGGRGGYGGGYQQQSYGGGYGGYGYGGGYQQPQGFHPGMNYTTPYHTDPYMRYGGY